MIFRIIFLLGLIVLSKDCLCQDTLQINELIYLADSLKKVDPSSSLTHAREAARLSHELNNYEKIKRSTQLISDAHYYAGAMDSVDYYNGLRVDYAKQANDNRTLAELMMEYALELERTNKDLKAVEHSEQAQSYFLKLNDSLGYANATYNLGLAYHGLDQYDECMKNYTEAMHIYHKYGDKNQEAGVIESMAIIHKQLGNYEKSLELHMQSRTLSVELKDEFGIMVNANNVGILYKNMGEYNLALDEYKKVLEYGNKYDHKGAQMSYYINSGILYNKLEQYKEGEEASRSGIAIAQDLGVPIAVADGKTNLGISLINQSRYTEAIKEVTESIELSKEIGALEKEQEAHKVAKDIYIKLNRANDAIVHMEAHQILKDSIFRAENIKEVNELQTKYETTKKDAEIEILNKNIEIDEVKRQRLWGGMALILFTSLAFIYGLIQRSKKKQALYQKEKAIEIERREKAEQELEFKKKELMAKVLQLAGKNEFLQKLEEEVLDLKSSVDQTVTKTGKRISRMIHQDAMDEDEWEQFSTEFSSVHQTFIQTLTERYGKFSQSELRLASLLKMNLATKDIANILRISDEGIKKARYRLRKKMNLKSGDDLQGILLGI